MASLLEAAGNVLDLPGSMIRDALLLRNPVDQFLSPLGQDNRTSGNELLNAVGLEGENPWLGLGVEMALDPTTYFGVGAIGKGAKGYKAASKALKAAGQKGGVRGVMSQLLGRKRVSGWGRFGAARTARGQALRDIPLTPVQETQAIAATAAATQASSFDEGLAIINAMSDGPAKQAALANFSELADAQRRVQAVARGVLPTPVDARASLTDAIIGANANAIPAVGNAITDLPSGWIGPQMADAIGNADDARLLQALTEGNTGLPYNISRVDVPESLRQGANSFAINRARQTNAAVDALANSPISYAEQPRVSPSANRGNVSRVSEASVPLNQYETYTREQLASMRASMESSMRHEQWASDGDGLRAEVARAAVRDFERQIKKIDQALASGVSNAPAAAPVSRAVDAALLMTQAIASPSTVDLKAAAKLFGDKANQVAAQASPPAAGRVSQVTRDGAMNAARQRYADAQARRAAQAPVPIASNAAMPAVNAVANSAALPIAQPDPLTQRIIRENYGGRDVFARDAYDTAVASAPSAGRKLLGRRLPTLNSLRNATYRDPNFRNLFGGVGAMLAVDEARANNPYDPLAEEQMSVDDDAVMRALLSFQGR